MKRQTAILVTAVSLLLAGCAPGMPGSYGSGYDGYPQSAYAGPSKQMLGGMGGAALGGLGCAQVGSGSGTLAAVAACTLGGWWIGSSIGSSLDKADALAAQRGFNSSMEYNAPVSWQGQNASGTYEPIRSGVQSSGLACREYQQTVTIGGRTQQAFGKACQQSDGSWRVAS